MVGRKIGPLIGVMEPYKPTVLGLVSKTTGEIRQIPVHVILLEDYTHEIAAHLREGLATHPTTFEWFGVPLGMGGSLTWFKQFGHMNKKRNGACECGELDCNYLGFFSPDDASLDAISQKRLAWLTQRNKKKEKQREYARQRKERLAYA